MSGGNTEVTPRPMSAVLVLPATTLAGSTHPTAMAPILGRSPFYRHVHHLLRLGAGDILVVLDPALDGGAVEDELRRQLAAIACEELVVSVVDGVATLPWQERIPDPECLVLRADTMADPRCYPLLLGDAGPRMLVDGGAGVGMMRVVTATIDPVSRESGVAGVLRWLAVPSADLLTVDLATIPSYLPDLRRHLPARATTIHSVADQQTAAAHLFASAQKGVLDFPARFLHPVPENAAVRLIADTPITPNMITVFTGVLGFWATWRFATGGVALALALALVVNVLDGVDGKLARVRLEASKFGDRLDHFLDVSFEFSWYLAIGWGLMAVSGDRQPMLVGAGLIAAMISSRAFSGLYKLRSGRQIHDHTAFDRGFRLIAGRRNIYVLVLLAGWLATGSLAGPLALCLGWGIATAMVYLVRVGMAWTGRPAHQAT